MSEQWKDVVGYEGLYQVSDLGRVKSIQRKDAAGRLVRERILKPAVAGGYPSVHLCKNRESKTKAVHLLVAQSFLGEKPEGAQVAHFDGNAMNPSLSNLRYASRRENEADKVRHGTRFYAKGESNGRSKLNEQHVIEIIHRYKVMKERQSHLAVEYGVDQSNISHIVRGVHWRHINGGGS